MKLLSKVFKYFHCNFGDNFQIILRNKGTLYYIREDRNMEKIFFGEQENIRAYFKGNKGMEIKDLPETHW